eukprot:scaffold222424_cov14-Tisochrysis_lutea.AAC.1
MPRVAYQNSFCLPTPMSIALAPSDIRHVEESALHNISCYSDELKSGFVVYIIVALLNSHCYETATWNH